MARHDPALQTISHYVLFGDEQPDDDPQFIHIEDIRTRSRLYEWQITPHTHRRMFQIVYLTTGSASVWIDDRTMRADAPAVVCVPAGVVHGFSFEPETVGWVLTMSELLLIDARYRRSRKLFEPLFGEPTILSFADNADGARLIATTLDEMLREFQWPQLGRGSMFEWMVRIVLMAIRREHDRQQPLRQPVEERRELFTRFRHLLEDNYKHHWSVAGYASSLGVSQARLNRMCRSFAGKGPSELIQDRLVLEAQRHLIYTSATASMIAYELGFQDPAYFSRLFKRRTGLAPGRFREEKMAEPFPH
ncbi:helix-turn-helix domain-containing protein [Rhodobium gokarnense]|uniref:AraC family transcriptional activator of pobA n=1 Tax=Rhodobium gokarnense TaxID=364296 RepID=A0ABT3HB32_9HYPH|nr:helix-turn-helix domain-containing protein [Rhodobium gokarnense]MCW2307501.1 AraC family transcriptional activator of pobA [Rhodobium gokarnense]